MTVLPFATTIPLCLAMLLFDPIPNIDHFDAERIRRAGIHVQSYERLGLGELPPRSWIKVTYDCSRLPDDQDVLVKYYVNAGGRRIAAFCSEGNTSHDDAVTLIFAIEHEYTAHSKLVIVIWRKTGDDLREAYGYQLSMKKILQLISEDEPTTANGAARDE